MRGPLPGVNKPKASGGSKGSKGAKAAKRRGKRKRCIITVAAVAAVAAADAAAAAAQIGTGQIRPESFLSADVLAKYRKSQTGKRDLVVDQLLQRKAHLTGMQETRQSHNGIKVLGNGALLSAAADKQGDHGCSLLVHLNESWGLLVIPRRWCRQATCRLCMRSREYCW